MNAGTRSPSLQVAAGVAAHAFCLQHPQKVDPPVHEKKLLAEPQDASGNLPYMVALKAAARMFP